MTRVDENNRFNKIRLTNGEEVQGLFRLRRGLGELGYASTVFVVSENGKRVFPLSQVVELTWED